MAGKKKFDFNTMHLSDIPKFIIALFKGQVGPEEEMMQGQTGFYEINLVPDIKAEMIKQQKLRNLVFFICLVVSIASVSAALILGSVKGAQDITMAGQDSHIDKLSKKVMDYEELPEFLTLQNQLRGISEIEDNQKVLSRAIIFLNALVSSSNRDSIEVSELSVDLAETTLSFDAQANAGDDDIDYRVLEAFIKKAKLMTFDYGRYVDSTGKEIPSRCIEEYNSAGRMYQENGSIYAIWKRGETGCDPNRNDYATDSDGTVAASLIDADLDATEMNNGTSEISQIGNDLTEEEKKKQEEDKQGQPEKKIIDYVPREKIYRTPQFTSWYNGEKFETEKDGIDDEKRMPSEDGLTSYNTIYYKYTPSMDLSGYVTGIPHFESKCITYIGEDTTDENASTNNKKTAKWTADNSCKLIPDDEGLVIRESANGRNAEDVLVLTFTATIQINSDAFAFRNKHVMTIGPNNQNVTDSYVQLEKIFAAPAQKCSSGDTECNNASTGGY
jgi:hypothetical protein